jgi:hypothetical protein
MDRRFLWFLGAGLAVALLVAGVLSVFASGEPDGLERVSIDQGFAAEAEEHDLAEAPLADYSLEGVDDDRLSTGLAGVIGVAATLLITLGLLYGVRRWRAARPGQGG